MATLQSPTTQVSHQHQHQQPQKPRGIVVFGGGTATNSLVDVFERIREQRGCSLSYVIPISDNGGSSSELIRMFGGPGIGDVRSRLVRLIPDSDTDPERRSLKELFNHRLSDEPRRARAEWLDIVEGSDRRLWRDISSEKRELIRSIFNLMNLEIVKRARPSSTFNFARASIGNLFLTGARLFTGSLESGIYLLSTICSVPGTVATLPVINSNFTHHISAGLADGTVIAGQNSISHPSAPTSLPAADDHHEVANSTATSGDGLLSPPPFATDAAVGSRKGSRTSTPTPTRTPTLETETEAHDLIEDATLPGSLPTLRKPYINFRKEGSSTPRNGSRTPRGQSRGGGGNRDATNVDGNKDDGDGVGKGKGVEGGEGNDEGIEGEEEEEEDDDLPTRIDRIWYINPYGHEIRPVPNPKVLGAIRSAAAVVYSIGSLYTSIMPSLILRGVGDAIAGSTSASTSTTTTTTTTNNNSNNNHNNNNNNNTAGGGQGQGQGQGQEGPRYKILILNSANDRETGPRAAPFAAADFVRAIARGAGAESRGEYYNRYIPAPAPVPLPVAPTTASTSTSADTEGPATTGRGAGAEAEAEAEAEIETEIDKAEVRRYVTHLIYVEGEGVPRVDREEIQGKLGVECVRVYGRRAEGEGSGGMLRYDETALERALEAIVGGRPDGGVGGRSRRNTRY